MIWFYWDDYGSGIIEKVRVGFDGPAGKFFQVLITTPEERQRFAEEVKHLESFLPKFISICPEEKDYYARKHQQVMRMSGSFDKVKESIPLSGPLDPPQYIDYDHYVQAPPPTWVASMKIDLSATHGEKPTKTFGPWSCVE